jgi:hypothetical protein
METMAWNRRAGRAQAAPPEGLPLSMERAPMTGFPGKLFASVSWPFKRLLSDWIVDNFSIITL